MNLYKKKIILALLFCLLIAVSLSIVTVNAAYADEASPAVYAEGTSYTSSHDVDVDTQITNSAAEAHAIYQYYQNCDLLPVQVYYAVLPHLEGGENITMSCVIESKITYKALGFLWKITDTYSENVTYDDLYDQNYVTGHYDGPDYDALKIVTVYTFYDAAYGACTWTITGE